MPSNSRRRNHSKHDTTNLDDFDRELVNRNKYSTTRSTRFEILRYGEPALPPNNNFYLLPELRRKFEEAGNTGTEVDFLGPSSHSASAVCYGCVSEFRMSDRNNNSGNRRALTRTRVDSNAPETCTVMDDRIVGPRFVKEDDVVYEKQSLVLEGGDDAENLDSRISPISEQQNKFHEESLIADFCSGGTVNLDSSKQSCEEQENVTILTNNLSNIGTQEANIAKHDPKCVDIFCGGGDFCIRQKDENVNTSEQRRSLEPHIKDILKFSKEDIKWETHAIYTIHAVLRYQGPSSAQQIFAVLPDYAELIGRPVVFSTCEELVDFVSHRLFVFEVVPHSNLIRNRGHGYREGVHSIAAWVKELSTSAKGCKLMDLWKRVVKHLLPFDSRDKSNMSDIWFTLHQISSVREFVDLLEASHSDLFIVSGKDVLDETFIQMNQTSYKIPSLWVSACFNQRSKLNYFDRSRIEQLFIKIKKTEPKIAEGYVIYGQFSGRTVELPAKNFGWENMLYVAPLKEIFSVQAYYVFDEKNDFVAVSMISMEDCLSSFSNRCSVTAEELEATSNIHDSDTNSSCICNTQLGEVVVTDSIVSLTTEQLQRLQRELETEKKKIDFATQFIKNENMSEEILGNKFVRNEENPFTSVDQFLLFLKTRSHLFNFEDGKISRVYHKDRVIIRQLIDFLSNFYEGLDLDEIENRVLFCQAGEGLANFSSMGNLNRYLCILEPMLNRNENINPEFERFCLKGTYLPQERILLPFYCINGIRRVCL